MNRRLGGLHSRYGRFAENKKSLAYARIGTPHRPARSLVALLTTLTQLPNANCSQRIISFLCTCYARSSHSAKLRFLFSAQAQIRHMTVVTRPEPTDDTVVRLWHAFKTVTSLATSVTANKTIFASMQLSSWVQLHYSAMFSSTFTHYHIYLKLQYIENIPEWPYAV
jgi:hypothetical protein